MSDKEKIELIRPIHCLIRGLWSDDQQGVLDILDEAEDYFDWHAKKIFLDLRVNAILHSVSIQIYQGKFEEAKGLSKLLPEFSDKFLLKRNRVGKYLEYVGINHLIFERARELTSLDFKPTYVAASIYGYGDIVRNGKL